MPDQPASPTTISGDHPDERILGILAAMRADPTRPWSLDELAERACYSRFHFARRFTETTGSSPGAFQTALRFGEARRLVLTTDQPVIEICAAVGYDGLGTFTSRFHRLTGLPPTGLRELPHRLAGLRLPTDRVAVPGDGTGTLPVRLERAEDIPDRPLPDSIYIGLFPSFQPAGRPLAGVWTRWDETITIPGVPPGHHYLLAAAFPESIDGHGHLLMCDGILVGGAGPLRCVAGTSLPPVTLHLAPPGPLSGPILTALPALLLDQRPPARRHVVPTMPGR